MFFLLCSEGKHASFSFSFESDEESDSSYGKSILANQFSLYFTFRGS